MMLTFTVCRYRSFQTGCSNPDAAAAKMDHKEISMDTDNRSSQDDTAGGAADAVQDRGESITLSDKFPQLEKLGDADFSEVISSYRAVLGSLQKELDEQS